MLGFDALPGLLLRLLGLLVDAPAGHAALLLLRPDGTALLEFAANLDFKVVSLLSVTLEALPAALTRAYVSARHEAALLRAATAEAELEALRIRVRQRCPALLMSPGKGGSSGQALSPTRRPPSAGAMYRM